MHTPWPEYTLQSSLAQEYKLFYRSNYADKQHMGLNDSKRAAPNRSIDNWNWYTTYSHPAKEEHFEANSR